MSESTLRHRLDAGWDFDAAVCAPALYSRSKQTGQPAEERKALITRVEELEKEVQYLQYLEGAVTEMLRLMRLHGWGDAGISPLCYDELTVSKDGVVSIRYHDPKDPRAVYATHCSEEGLAEAIRKRAEDEKAKERIDVKMEGISF